MPNPLSRVVVHSLEGQITPGVTHDFSPNCDKFHVTPTDKKAALRFDTRKLKAIFFVHDFEGNRLRRDRPGFLGGPAETRHGGKVAVLFRDKELICGYALSCKPEKGGFYLFPADFEGNNIRIFVFRNAAEEIQTGPAADDLAGRILNSRAA